MTGRRTTTTHYRRGSTAACTARIRPPWLTAEMADVDCGNCTRTDAYRTMAHLPPVPADAVADAADVPMLLEWMERTG